MHATETSMLLQQDPADLWMNASANLLSWASVGYVGHSEMDSGKRQHRNGVRKRRCLTASGTPVRLANWWEKKGAACSCGFTIIWCCCCLYSNWMYRNEQGTILPAWTEASSPADVCSSNCGWKNRSWLQNVTITPVLRQPQLESLAAVLPHGTSLLFLIILTQPVWSLNFSHVCMRVAFVMWASIRIFETDANIRFMLKQTKDPCSLAHPEAPGKSINSRVQRPKQPRRWYLLPLNMEVPLSHYGW